MATRVGMKSIVKKEPVPIPAPAEPETILPDVAEELEKAVKPKKVIKRSKKTTK